jgi:hypothetical protein
MPRLLLPSGQRSVRAIKRRSEMASLSECEALLREHREQLVERICGVPDLGPARLPLLLKLTHEAQQWRLQTLAAEALGALERSERLSAVLISRAAFETLATLHYLGMELSAGMLRKDLSRLNEVLPKLFLGQRDQEDALYKSINVVTTIEHLAKRTSPEVAKTYFELSEYCHPNWLGAMGTFGRVDAVTQETHFGPWREDDRWGVEISLIALKFSLALAISERSYLQASVGPLQRLLSGSR